MIGELNAKTISEFDPAMIGEFYCAKIGEFDAAMIGEFDSATIGEFDAATIGEFNTATIFLSVDARSASIAPPKRKTGNGKGTSKSKVGRRSFFFKQRGSVIRGTTRVASVVSKDVVYHKGQFWQKGDIVSVVDEDDDEVRMIMEQKESKLVSRR